jgi:Flp pilus assembly protein TadD
MAFQLSFALLASIACAASNFGCHPSDSQLAIDNAQSIKGDVARNAALARAYTAQACTLLQSGDTDDAEPMLNRAIAADPNYGPARNDLGMVYYQRGKLYDAAWQFENASKLMPDEPAPQNNLGLVLEKSAKFPEALTAYERACELDPDGSEYAGNFARLRIRLGMRDATTARLLQLVIERDTRPEWVNWARLNLIKIGSSPAPAP